MPEVVAESGTNRDLVARYAKRYQLDTNLFYSTLEEMLDKTQPQAVAIFTSTFDHRHVVEICAARGIHAQPGDDQHAP